MRGCEVWSLLKGRDCLHYGVKKVVIAPNGLGISVAVTKLSKFGTCRRNASFWSLEGHTEGVNYLTISHDSQFLYSGDDLASITMWNLKGKEGNYHFIRPKQGYCGPA